MSVQMKKFVDIRRVKSTRTENIVAGEHIVIQTKIDGSNASIRYDAETDTLLGFSRRMQLGKENTLNGFWTFVQTLPVDKFKEVIGTRYIIFGEWMTKHKIQYPDGMYGKFYMFDVYDTEIGQYLPQSESHKIHEKLAEYIIEYVHTLYDGPFISWEHVYSFMPMNTYGESPCMEGVIIKRQDRLHTNCSRDPFYIKLIADQFAEIQKIKTVDPEKLMQREKDMAVAETIVTKRRVEKCLEKFVEDQLIPEDWGTESMKQISKLLPRAVYEDCQKEEPETVAMVENFGKCSATLSMKYAREIMNERYV